MKLGIKLSLTISVVVGVVIASYGYWTVMNRRHILTSRLKREVRAIARTARIYVEQLPHLKAQDIEVLVNGIGEFEKTLGVFIDVDGIAYQSTTLDELPDSFDRNRLLGKKVIEHHEVIEDFDRYGKTPVYVYFEPLTGSRGQVRGSLGIIQHTLFLEEDIWATQLSVLLTIVLLIALIIGSVLVLTRYNITRPVGELITRIRKVGLGEFDTEALGNRNDELGELADEFNQMAESLRETEKRIRKEQDKKADLEQRMRHMERLATIGQLASGLAHEIGTPLNVIGGRAGYLREKIRDRKAIEKNLDIIVRQSERITKIIKKLLSYSRKESPRLVQMEVSPAIEGALDLLDHQTRKQGIKITKVLSQNLPRVRGDPDQLQQVFLNLIHNAIQAMPNGGELVLEGSLVRRAEGQESVDGSDLIQVHIKDNGCGMKEDVFQNMFKPFFTTKTHGKGTGLGLPIAYSIVRDHGGNMNAESEEGKGTTITVSLPVSTPQNAEVEAKDEEWQDIGVRS
jgi:signal transduction histidine kinase